jgi:hypothetical protein
LRTEPCRAPAPSTKIDRELRRAAGRIRLLAAVTPTNLAEERARVADSFARGDPRAPRFTYERCEHGEVRRALEVIARAIPGEFPAALAQVYSDRVEELALEARIAESAGTPTLGLLSLARFSEGSAEVARESRDQAAEWLLPAPGLPGGIPPEPPAPTPSTTRSDADDPCSLVSMMRREVGARRLPFAVVTSLSLSCRAATGERTIWVAAGRQLTSEEARRTVLHEVEGHALPRARASRRPAIFSIGTARGADDQEGYALLVEERAGAMGPARKRELAARHWAAVRMAAGADFVEVTRGLVREHDYPAPEAIDVAERVFRGAGATGQGLGRERVYIGAWLRVRRRLFRRPGDEEVLASGQVSVCSIDELREL